MYKYLNQQEIQNICGIIADTNRGLTKSELKKHLMNCHIEEVDDVTLYTQDGISQVGLNKRDWLYNCLVNKINAKKSTDCVFVLIKSIVNPINFTDETKREKHRFIIEELNKILLLIGYEIINTGAIRETVKAKTLDEVDRRVNSLNQKLYQRSIHYQVRKYCIRDYLRKDYYDAVFEATKGISDRIQKMVEIDVDGVKLYEYVLSTKEPKMVINTLKSQSEINEHRGLKELLIAITHLIRNPAAHTPKINWKMDETLALDVLTLISMAHKYIDECIVIKDNN